MKCILFGTMAAIVVSASAKPVVWYDMSNDAADGMITAETTFTNIASPSNEFYGKIGYGAHPNYGSYTKYLPVATASFEEGIVLQDATFGPVKANPRAVDIPSPVFNEDGTAVSADNQKGSAIYTYDPEKAKSLLEEAGATGMSFELMVNNNWVKNLSAQIKNDLDAIGLNCTINETKIDWAKFAPSDSELPYDVMLTPGDPSCFGNDPDLLMSWWYGNNVWTTGRTCWQKATDGKWNELNDLMQKAREASASDQQGIWNQCFDILAEQVPLYPLFHRELATGYQADKIAGFEPIATTGLVFLGASCK